MANSIREQIIAASVAAIDAATTTTVYRSRVGALAAGQLPAIVVFPQSDSPGEADGSLCWSAWTLMLAVDVVVAGDPPDGVADALVQVVHSALMAEPRTLGVAGVTDINPGGVEFLQEPSGDVTGVTRCMYAIRYRTRQANLAALP